MVVDLLLPREDVASVVRLSRRDVTPSSVKLAWDARTTYRPMDYTSIDSLREAFAGLQVLIFPGSDGDPKQLLAHHRNVVRAAVECGVGAFIYLSTLGAARDSPFPYARVHAATEELLAQSSAHMRIRVLRASIFAEFFIEAFVEPSLSAGVMQLPVPSGRVSFVSKTDVARALVGAALLEEDPVSDHIPVWNITGGFALSVAEVCDSFDVGATKRVVFDQVTESEYREQLKTRGYEDWLIEVFAIMLSYSIPNGCFELVSSDVQRLAGVEPLKFADIVGQRQSVREHLG